MKTDYQKQVEKLVGTNVYNKPVEVIHADLERENDDSMFRSVCPVCKFGTLFVRRLPETFGISENDNCILCGQMFVYKDIEDLKRKAGEVNEPKRNAGEESRS